MFGEQVVSGWLTDISIEPQKAAELATYQKRHKSSDGFTSGHANSQIPRARFIELTGSWVASNGSPYRIPVMSEERRERLKQMRADNDALLRKFMKRTCLDHPHLTLGMREAPHKWTQVQWAGAGTRTSAWGITNEVLTTSSASKPTTQNARA